MTTLSFPWSLVQFILKNSSSEKSCRKSKPSYLRTLGVPTPQQKPLLTGVAGVIKSALWQLRVVNNEAVQCFSTTSALIVVSEISRGVRPAWCRLEGPPGMTWLLKSSRLTRCWHLSAFFHALADGWIAAFRTGSNMQNLKFEYQCQSLSPSFSVSCLDHWPCQCSIINTLLMT